MAGTFAHITLVDTLSQDGDVLDADFGAKLPGVSEISFHSFRRKVATFSGKSETGGNFGAKPVEP
jgi:hypothetical protein